VGDACRSGRCYVASHGIWLPGKVIMRRSLCLVMVLAAALLITAAQIGTDPARAVSSPFLRIDAPKQAQVGHPITIRLFVEGAADVGGYETNILFDKKSAEFTDLTLLGKELTNLEPNVGPLGPVVAKRGVSIGAFSCPVEDCVYSAGSPKAQPVIGGTAELATVTVIPNRAGRIEFKLSATRVVDTSGEPVSVKLKNDGFAVQVGPPRKASATYAAPDAVSWKLKRPASSSSGAVDLTGDRRVTYADAMEAAIEWTVLREDGVACGESAEASTSDVNRDGCIDIADVQTIVANYRTDEASGDSLATTRAKGAVSATSVFTVDSTGDEADPSPGDGVCAASGGACTLRAAILEANRRSGPDTIAFDIPGTGVHTIEISRTLPTINDESGPTTIDGYTQPGSSPNTAPLASNANINVQITTPTPYADNVYGLKVTSPGNVIRGLSLFKVRRTIWLYGSNATNNTIAGSFIGTDSAGNFAATKMVDDGEGVRIQNQASGNFIGVASPEGRNVISGNARRGVSLFGGARLNRIVNNIIGLSPAGDRRLANIRIGVDHNLSSANNRTGGTQPFERNVISGNGWEGVELSHGTAVTGNEVIGNFIGTDLTGNAAPAYASYERWGVQIEDRPSNNLIADNVIGNSRTKGGILITEVSNNNQIRGNRIGISADGTPIPNALAGVQIDGNAGLSSFRQHVANNVIAHNGLTGVRIYGADSDRNTITRNSIFANAGLGIDLQPLGQVNPNDSGDTDAGANEQLNFPELQIATPVTVSGTACAGCTVEIFVADGGQNANGEGKTFVGSAVARTDGSFSVAVSGVAGGDIVTATATDALGNTSEFSANKLVSNDATVPASPTGLAATASTSGIALDWEDNSEPDLDGYNVYRSDSLNGTYTKLNASPLAASQYNDTEAPAGKDSYYRVTAIDKSGNESQPAAVSAFRPEAVDTTAPTILSKTPTANSTGVALSTNVDVTFSEPMDPTTISNSTFRLVISGTTTPIAAAVSYDEATRKATLDPNAELLPNTTYKVTVNTGVKDVAGNAMAKLQTWQFTTGAP
jgi:CSLREA domain-containing protein